MNTTRYTVCAQTGALIIVDPQVAFGAAVPVPDVEGALANMRRVAQAWRAAGGQVLVTRHIFTYRSEVGRVADFLGEGIYEALGPGSRLVEFHPNLVEKADLVFDKNRFSALKTSNKLGIHLAGRAVETVVVCGLTTPICVGATVDALNMSDYKVMVVGDACASQAMGRLSAQEAHDAAIDRMRYIFAQVVTTDELVGQL